MSRAQRRCASASQKPHATLIHPPRKRWAQETPTEGQRSPTVRRLPEIAREVPARHRRSHRHGSRALAPDGVRAQPARRAARLAVDGDGSTAPLQKGSSVWASCSASDAHLVTLEPTEVGDDPLVVLVQIRHAERVRHGHPEGIAVLIRASGDTRIGEVSKSSPPQKPHRLRTCICSRLSR